MPEKYKRRLFSLNNKYQKQILILSVAPPLFITVGLTFFLLYIEFKIDNGFGTVDSTLWVQDVIRYFTYSFYFVFIISIASLIFSFRLSQNLVDPFDRIIKEMDDVLRTGEKKVIKARPKDELANDLLKRINEMISRMKA